MAELTHGQVMPMSGALAQNDSNGKPLEFKAANEEDKNNNVWIAEGSDGKIYTISAQPQVATVSVVKKKRDDSLPQINDPYYQRVAANAPKAEGDTKDTTEARETDKFGKPAKDKLYEKK